MIYQPYFSVHLFHSYYQQGTCFDFLIEPTQQCQRMLQRYRAVFRPESNGLQVLMPVAEGTSSPLPSAPFCFFLKLKRQQEFLRVTELGSGYQPNAGFYVYSNESLVKADSDLESTWVQREVLAPPTKIFERYTPQKNEVFGIIEIHNNKALDQTLQKNADFSITFSAQKRYWTYCLVTDPNVSTTDFSIQDKRGEVEFVNTSSFTDQAREPIQEDLLSAIEKRFPNSQAIVFQSSAPVSDSESARADLQLMVQKNKKNGKKTANSSNGIEDNSKKDKTWMPHLPNPPNGQGVQVINLLKDV